MEFLDPRLAPVLHFAVCVFMTGVIWVVQLILYPAFASIERGSFREFHRSHSSRITYIVGPAMLLELITALLLAGARGGWWWVNLAGVGLLWATTALLSVPIHNFLAVEFDSARVRRLVATNWPRTLLWTVRSIALTAVLAVS